MNYDPQDSLRMMGGIADAPAYQKRVANWAETKETLLAPILEWVHSVQEDAQRDFQDMQRYRRLWETSGKARTRLEFLAILRKSGYEAEAAFLETKTPNKYSVYGWNTQ